MPLNFPSVACHGAATIIKTFFLHFLNREERTRECEARGSLRYDEAFSLVKDFLERSTRHTVEELQAFCSSHVPVPCHVKIIRVKIPSSTCNSSSRVLLSHFPEEEIEHVVKGREWWQQRPTEFGGIWGEWIGKKKDWDGRFGRREADGGGEKRTGGVEGEEEEMDDGNVLFFINGGGYFFGSIDTHRCMIWRIANRIKGKAFSVRYRLAPQYPWPCALSDVLAGYLYLINPPPEAKHLPINPSKLFIGGDSAGGGLALSLLCLLRDEGLPLPAGGILMSPWVDMTHSFGSIMRNTGTDYLPLKGFIYRPSVTWPPPKQTSHPSKSPTTTATTARQTGHPPKGDDEKKAAADGIPPPDDTKEEEEPISSSPTTQSPSPPEAEHGDANVHVLADHDIDLDHEIETPKGSHREGGQGSEDTRDADERHRRRNPFELRSRGEKIRIVRETDGGGSLAGIGRNTQTNTTTFVELEVEDGKKVRIEEQIQLYAENDQLTHPLVSPLLQPSLGGLCPLLIIAGDKELLRDEIIYLGHRAADPRRYPLRKSLLEANGRRAEKAEEYPPTQVNLQIYDDFCHVLPLFMFTDAAKHAYAEIAVFCQSIRDPDIQSLASAPDIGAQGVPSSPLPVESFTRQRVDIHGRIRPLEPPHEIEALTVDCEDVGVLKEGPLKRWYEGTQKRDRAFAKLQKSVHKRRQKTIDKAFSRGVLIPDYMSRECPPASAIAGRRDTPEALRLAKTIAKNPHMGVS